MPQTKIGVIYNEETGQVLRVVVPDDDAQLDLHAGSGEKIIKLNKTDYQTKTKEDIHKIVEDASGKIFKEKKADPVPDPGGPLQGGKT